MKNILNKYYIYAHVNPLKNEIFYIGKGFDKRAYSKKGRSNIWKNTVAKYGYIIDILQEGLTEEEAFDREIWYIKRIGRKNLGIGPLVNLTDGGEGCSGLKHSDETKQKLSEINSGKIIPREIVDKITKANTGKKRTQELKDKLSTMFKGKKWMMILKKNVDKDN